MILVYVILSPGMAARHHRNDPPHTTYERSDDYCTRSSSTTSATTTVTLSGPPAASASSTSRSAQFWGSVPERRTHSIASSATTSDSPSVQSMKRSLARGVSSSEVASNG